MQRRSGCTSSFFFFQAEDGIRDYKVTGVQTCALPICHIPLTPLDSAVPSSQVSRPLQFTMTSRPVPTTHSRPLPAGLTREQLLEIYRYLRLTRTLEERLTALYRQSKVIGGVFRALGQEGGAGGAAYGLGRRRDRES